MGIKGKNDAETLDKFISEIEKLEMYEKGEIPTSERNFTAPRLTELSYKGIVEPVGKQKCSYTGKMVAVYKIRAEQTNI